MQRAIALILLAGLPLYGFSQLTEAEQNGIDDVLRVGNFRRSDLSFERFSTTPPKALPIILQGIYRPFDTANQLMKLHAACGKESVGGLVDRALLELLDLTPGNVAKAGPLTGADDLPPGLRKTVLQLAGDVKAADDRIRKALSGLAPTELRELIEGLPVLAVEEPSVKFSFVKGSPVPAARVRQLLAKVNVGEILMAGRNLATASETAAAALKTNQEPFEGLKRLNVGGLTVEIGGRGNDVHSSSDARIMIDLGGDDTYTGRAGAGVGYSSVLIDCSGDDRYRVGDLSIGSGLFGAGIAIDSSGNDIYQGQSLTFGSGMGGFGLLQDLGGHDTYRSATLSQGYGQNGAGLLVDMSGNDAYNVQLYGQGAARTEGVGWLIDKEGADNYWAGGLVLNSPLFATAHYSFSQGFGSGYREDTGGFGGGVGLLTDLAGDDAYIGETYMQAASYWMALGTLYDASGNDTYSGYHYCQASSMHLCGSYFFDLAGDDGYIVKVGAAHSIGHDYGTSFFLDRAGDDIYASRDSTPGIGVANGVGIFIEGGGTDRYHGPPGKGNASRGTGSIGLFVDLGGPDIYKFGLEDGGAAFTNSWGAALDYADIASQSGANPNQSPAWPTPGSLPKPDDKTLEQLYAKAIQWSVGTAQKEVQDAVGQLIGIGVPAIQWMLDKKLATSDRLSNRAFVAVIGGIGAPAKKAAADKFSQATEPEIMNLIRISMDAGITEAGPAIAKSLDNPATRNLAISASGALKLEASVPALISLTKSDQKMIVRSAMTSLMQIGSEQGVAAANALMANDDPLTRKSAIALAAKFPENAINSAKELIADADEFRVRIGLELLGAINTPLSLSLLGARLTDERPAVRLEAVIRLNGRCPAEFKAAYDKCKDDPDPLVRAAAKLAK